MRIGKRPGSGSTALPSPVVADEGSEHEGRQTNVQVSAVSIAWCVLKVLSSDSNWVCASAQRSMSEG